MMKSSLILHGKVLTVLGAFLVLAACNSLDEKETLTGKLDWYYKRKGKNLEALVSWMHDSLGLNASGYGMETRSRGGAVVFCKIDSNGKWGGYFTPTVNVPGRYMKSWGSTTISDVIKRKNESYYEMILGEFIPTGHDIRIIITAPGWFTFCFR